ncbi:uncharacterized protein C2orf72 homolog [Rhinatrema bivittatum]|uniref:uncharacterized protein C2orf72 homolog n=1 Tax=Rhinatrema bivittatum TaxID=194408 RepID=UPI00112EA5AD|nr:uncharacterized protein C2orf72 homolog [Rhinatrema bivittatum]
MRGAAVTPGHAGDEEGESGGQREAGDGGKGEEAVPGHRRERGAGDSREEEEDDEEGEKRRSEPGPREDAGLRAAGTAVQAERAFLRALALIGGRERVLLVGELWERGPSRELLRRFVLEIFGECSGRGPAGPGAGAREPRYRLLFLLCRPPSLRRERGRRGLRAVAEDVRARLRGGCGSAAAVVGALVEEEEEGGAEPGEEVLLPRLIRLLRGVFPGEQRVQAAAYRLGELASALEVKRAACRALRAAEEEQRAGDEERTPPVLQCFPWRWRKRRKNHQAKAASGVTEVSTAELRGGAAVAMSALCEPLNGVCGESVTEAASQRGAQPENLERRLKAGPCTTLIPEEAQARPRGQSPV